MSGLSYNGYDIKQRNRILRAYHRGEAGPDFTFAGHVCAMCCDPERAPGEWHSEDYSEPFLFTPPATYPMCKCCHGRIHKRFNAPKEEWQLFCMHLEAGGYGREFVPRYPKAKRTKLIEPIRDGELREVAKIRTHVDREYWWRTLTLDAESVEAPWARPRPMRPRPDAASFSRALSEIDVTDTERAILSLHAHANRRTITMRQLAEEILGSARPSSANLIYGRLAHRLSDQCQWEVDRRDDGSPIWMSLVAEGWQPKQRPEYEWVMVPSLQNALLALD